MFSIRVIAAAAAALFVVDGAATGAGAQTTASEAQGKPLQLLQMLKIATPTPNAKSRHRIKAASAPPNAKSKHQIKTASANRPRKHIKLAEAKPPAPVAAASAAFAVDPGRNADEPAADARPAPEPASAPSDQIPGEIVVPDQSVNVAAPDEVNELDLAAEHSPTQPPAAVPGSGFALASIASADLPQTEVKSNAPNVAAAEQRSGGVGSTAWIMQVLAALGGAAAAGSLAWFLIGSTPQRTYG
jgi:hypothetical protein